MDGEDSGYSFIVLQLLVSALKVPRHSDESTQDNSGMPLVAHANYTLIMSMCMSSISTLLHKVDLTAPPTYSEVCQY